MQLSAHQLDDLIEVLDAAREAAHAVADLPKVQKIAPLLRLARGERWAKKQLAREDRERIAAHAAAKGVTKIAAGRSAIAEAEQAADSAKRSARHQLVTAAASDLLGALGLDVE